MTLDGLVGYGTLVINVTQERVEERNVFKMLNGAQWHGVIILQLNVERIEETSGIVELDGSSMILGGLGINFRSLDRLRDLSILNVINGSKILFSSDLIEDAPGLNSALSGSTIETANVVNYRIQ